MNARNAFAKMGRNFITPEVIDYYDLPNGLMVELSEGKGLDNEPLYGVSVMGDDGEIIQPQSKLFWDRWEANAYIVGLGFAEIEKLLCEHDWMYTIVGLRICQKCDTRE